MGQILSTYLIGIDAITIYTPTKPIIIGTTIVVEFDITVIPSTGNNPTYWGVSAPGNSPYLILVGATTAIGDSVAEYSAKGPMVATWEIKPDMVAPGTIIYNDLEVEGTSFATPYVAGVAALVLQEKPEWSLAELMK